MKLIYTGEIKEGKLKITNRKGFDEDMLTLDGKSVVISIEKKKSKRSDAQNRYWWGVVIPIVKQGLKDAGFQDYKTGESVHELLKYRFLKTDSVSEHGETLERIKSSTELSKGEFMELIAEVQQWSAEYLSYIIPDPGTQTQIGI